MVKDGHIHTPYCPHGTQDTLKEYIERGIQLGYKKMTFTEHAPLPKAFIDPVTTQDSAMQMAHLDKYFIELTKVKDFYKGEIDVLIGLEVDFISGYERETERLLNEWGPSIDDAILSVHFLKYSQNHYVCMDYSPRAFQDLISEVGSVEAVYKLYYDTVSLSVEADLGRYKPKRIGHISLVRKFQRLFPRTFQDDHYIEEILVKMKEKGYSLDVNGAGLIKPHCKEFYPPLYLVKKAAKMNIPLVYGSDAHSSQQLGQGINEFNNLLDEEGITLL